MSDETNDKQRSDAGLDRSSSAACPPARRNIRRRRLVSLCVIALLAVVTVILVRTDRKPPSPWRSRPLGTDATFRDIFFLDDQVGWMVGGSHTIAGGVLATTTDGGRSWDFDSGLFTPKRGSGWFDLLAVHFFDRSHGLIAAPSEVIRRTADGGRTWTTVQRGRASGHIFEFEFLDRNVGWAVGTSHVLRTNDGGRSWQPIGTRRWLSGRAIEFLDRDHGWLVWKHGTLERTTDGGEHWTKVALPDSLEDDVDLNDIVFVDRQRGWVVGEATTILATVDGGLTWSLQATGGPFDLTSVAFADTAMGWAVGYDNERLQSIILHTVNGGRLWRVEARAHDEELRVVETVGGRALAVGARVRPQPQMIWSTGESTSTGLPAASQVGD